MSKIFFRRVIIAVCFLALVLFFVRPRVGRLRGAVAQAISQGLGRSVTISSIHLRLVPRPGFEIDDLVVQDDPRFGSEPLLRAPDVTAWLRLSSLLHGRIEIASLYLSEASLNLTRNESGRWNIEDLIERASHTALAPTAHGAEPSRASFPYIAATGGRINFKVGQEKTHLALTNAEFALWQDSADTWGARVKAAPVRTDANLTDTGVINLSGTWGRSSTARQTPLQVSFQWKQAQIGQLSRLVYGTDKAWRGGVLISGALSGTPQQLQVVADGSVGDFRQRDVIGGGNLHLMAHCVGDLNLPGRNLSNLDCMAASGPGFLELKGSASGPPSNFLPFSTYDFWLVASKVPAENIVRIAQHADVNFGPSLSADGELDGSFEFGRENASKAVRVQGSGAVHGLKIISAATGTEIPAGTVPITLISAKAPPLNRSRRTKVNLESWIPLGDTHILLGPVNVAVGRPEPLHTAALISWQGFSASLKGEGKIAELLQDAHMLGIPAPSVSAEGNANVELSLEGRWWDLHPTMAGSAQLRSVQAQVVGLNMPIEISNAHLTITPESVRVQEFEANIAGTVWKGLLDVPRPCPLPSECSIAFNLRAASLNSASLNSLLNPGLAKSPWYHVLSPGSAEMPYLMRARASGKLLINQLILGSARISDVSADVKLNAGDVQLLDLSARALGGRLTGAWSANFGRKKPVFSGNGTLDGVSLAQVSQLMNNEWAEGTGSVRYAFSSAGKGWQELIASADLTAQFTVTNGVFPHIALVGATEALRASEFSGNLHLRDGTIDFANAKLRTSTGPYSVNGTAGINGVLALRLANETSGFNITGTLARTTVSSIPTAQAALKP